MGGDCHAGVVGEYESQGDGVDKDDIRKMGEIEHRRDKDTHFILIHYMTRD